MSAASCASVRFLLSCIFLILSFHSYSNAQEIFRLAIASGRQAIPTGGKSLNDLSLDELMDELEKPSGVWTDATIKQVLQGKLQLLSPDNLLKQYELQCKANRNEFVIREISEAIRDKFLL